MKPSTLKYASVPLLILVAASVQAQCIHNGERGPAAMTSPGPMADWFVLGFMGLLVGGFVLWLVELFRSLGSRSAPAASLENIELEHLQEETFEALAEMELEYERIVLEKLEAQSKSGVGRKEYQAIETELVTVAV